MKTISKLLTVSLIAFVAMSFSSIQPDKKTLKIDTEYSNVTWKAEKVTREHQGTINFANGTLEMEEDQLVGGSFEIDMTSIKNTDMEGDMAKNLEGHLRSEDFFNVTKFPKAKFVTTKVVPRGPAGSFKVTGNLTIKGITKEYKFNTTISANDEVVKASAIITIDRTDFDVRYDSSTFFGALGDKTIYDEFVLNIEIRAGK